MIIVATATGDMPFPSVANILQEKLDTRKVPTMDQLAACSGFMYSMITAKQYVQSGDYKNILVVGADKLSKITDLTDRSTAVLFGDGAGAVVIGEVSEGRGIISYEMGSDGNGGKYLYLNKDTGKLVMNGREVFKFAVRIMVKHQHEWLIKLVYNQMILICLYLTKQTLELWNQLEKD